MDIIMTRYRASSATYANSFDENNNMDMSSTNYYQQDIKYNETRMPDPVCG
jgi:hypothetical protein